jgi:hypothetical protein
MGRQFTAVLTAATIVVTLGLSGCSSDERGASTESESVQPAAPVSSTTPPQVAPLPPSADLAKVLYRLADPAVPGAQKLSLVEGATPDSAATFDQFATALQNGGFTPMKVNVRDMAWSDRDPANVDANVDISSSDPKGPRFAFPMEFAPFQGGWQLSARTADVLLAYSPAQAAPPATTPGR